MKEANTSMDILVAEHYEKPSIEIIEMELEDGVLLTASTGKGSNMPNGGGGSF